MVGHSVTTFSYIALYLYTGTTVPAELLYWQKQLFTTEHCKEREIQDTYFIVRVWGSCCKTEQGAVTVANTDSDCNTPGGSQCN